MTNNKLTLTDSINYEQELKGRRFVQIFSGVGSGKNYFVERFLEGDEEHKIPKKTVLIITSRKAKVQEVLAEDKRTIEAHVRQQWDEFFHRYEDEENYDEDKIRTIYDEWGTHRIYQKSVVCTNAFIEQYLKYIYNPSCATTHLWELFDIIIIDEVHSVVMDATYQSAPFYIHELVNEFIHRHNLADEKPDVYKRPQCEQIIMMTGTREPIKTLKIPERHSTVIDRMDTCKSVQPKNVRFITLEEAKFQIADQLARGERIVYFQNHTTLPSEFCKETDIDPSAIVPSFSKDEKRRLIKRNHPSLYKRMEYTEKSLREKGIILEDVKLLLTTGRNKEGININDEDIKTMYVESHLFSDIVQMAGRVRTGVADLYIIVDSSGYSYSESKFESAYARRWIAGTSEEQTKGAANQELKRLCCEHGVQDELFNNRSTLDTIHRHKNLEEYVDFIHQKYPYVRYSYFDNIFKYYHIKNIGLMYQCKSIAKFNCIIENPDACIAEFQKWFPDAVIHPYYTVDMKAQEIFNKYIPIVEGKDYDDSICFALREELKKECYPELNKLQAMLNRFCNLIVKRVSNDPKKPGYQRRRFVERVAEAA